jgi:DNA-binding MarR family transcriptional regulator
MANTSKIVGKFYPLQNAEWVELSQKLNHSELRVLYYLRTLDPFGDRFREASTKAIAQSLQISQRTVQRAIFRLAQLELIDLEISTFNFRVRSLHATAMSLSDTDVASPTVASPESQPCRPDDTQVAQMSPPSPLKPENVTATESHPFKTINTYSDLIDTLSEAEREKFERFCERKSEGYPNPVVLMESWIEKHFQELYREYQRIYCRKYSAEYVALSPSKNETLHPEIAQGLADGRIKKLDPLYDPPSLWTREGYWMSQQDWLETYGH